MEVEQFAFKKEGEPEASDKIKTITIKFENKDNYQLLGNHRSSKVQGNLTSDEVKEIITQIYEDIKNNKIQGI